MTSIEITNVSFGYTALPVMVDFSLSIQFREVVSLVGPSGCGKSTLLRLIAGLESPSAGEIHVIRAAADASRNKLGFLFQDYDAYPWYSVWDNVQRGSGPRPYPADSTVNEMLSQVGLASERDRFPGELSGGMRKRLALARCLIRHPSLLLLDEPFSSLDVDTRYSMYEMVQRLWRESPCAVLLVTHDLHEATFLSDRMVVLSSHPMGICEVVDVTFPRPRTDAIYSASEYLNIIRHVTALLRNTFQAFEDRNDQQSHAWPRSSEQSDATASDSPRRGNRSCW